MNLHKHVWTEALQMEDFRLEGNRNKERLESLVSLAEGYEKRVKEETELTKEQLRTRYVGKVDPKKHIEAVGQELIEDNIVAVSRQMIDKEASVPTLGGPSLPLLSSLLVSTGRFRLVAFDTFSPDLLFFRTTIAATSPFPSPLSSIDFILVLMNLNMVLVTFVFARISW